MPSTWCQRGPFSPWETGVFFDLESWLIMSFSNVWELGNKHVGLSRHSTIGAPYVNKDHAQVRKAGVSIVWKNSCIWKLVKMLMDWCRCWTLACVSAWGAEGLAAIFGHNDGDQAGGIRSTGRPHSGQRTIGIVWNNKVRGYLGVWLVAIASCCWETGPSQSTTWQWTYFLWSLFFTYRDLFSTLIILFDLNLPKYMT